LIKKLNGKKEKRRKETSETLTILEAIMEKMEPIFDLHERTFRFAVQITKAIKRNKSEEPGDESAL
jgi:hypothetical protein